MSDTRGAHQAYSGHIPRGHILIHSGDFAPRPPKRSLSFTSWYRRLGTHFSRNSTPPTQQDDPAKPPIKENWQLQLEELDRFFAQQPHQFKLFVPGCWENWYSQSKKRRPTPSEIQSHLKSAIYLQDAWCQILGLKIYGTPWTSADDLRPEDSSYLSRNWNALIRLAKRTRWQKTNRLERVPETNREDAAAVISTPVGDSSNCAIPNCQPPTSSITAPNLSNGFVLPDIDTVAKTFAKIPPCVDIMVSHMPPWRDELFNQVTGRIKPTLHLCGHDFAAYGVVWKDDILFSNAALQLTSDIPPVQNYQSSVSSTKPQSDNRLPVVNSTPSLVEADDTGDSVDFREPQLFVKQPSGRPRPPRWQRRLPSCLSRFFLSDPDQEHNRRRFGRKGSSLLSCSSLRRGPSRHRRPEYANSAVVVSETLSSKAAVSHQVNTDGKFIYDPDMRAGLGAISVADNSGPGSGSAAAAIGPDGTMLRTGATFSTSSYSGSIGRVSGASTAFCSSFCQRNPVVIDVYVVDPDTKPIILPSYAESLINDQPNVTLNASGTSTISFQSSDQ